MNKIEIKHNNEVFDLPIVKGTENETGINIQQLRSKTNLITLDPGLKIQVHVKALLLF